MFTVQPRQIPTRSRWERLLPGFPHSEALGRANASLCYVTEMWGALGGQEQLSSGSQANGFLAAPASPGSKSLALLGTPAQVGQLRLARTLFDATSL